MNKSFFSLFVLLFFAKLLAQSGFVFDEKNKPLDSVLVFTKETYVYSSKNGYFDIFAGDNEEIRFYKNAYQTKTILSKLALENLAEVKKTERKKELSVILPKNPPPKKTPQNPTSQKFFSFRENCNSLIINLENEKQKYGNLAEILLQYYNIKGNALSGETAEVILDGTKSSQVAVYLDDILLNYSGTAINLNFFPIEFLSKVQINKNSARQKHIGGEIRLYSKQKTNSQIDFSQNFSYGSFSLFSSATLFFLNKKDFSVSLFYKNQFAKNNFKFKDLYGEEVEVKTRENNEKKIQNVFFTLSKNFKADFQIKYNLFYQEYKKNTPGQIRRAYLYETAFMKGKEILHNFSLNKKGEIFDFNSKFYFKENCDTYDNSNSSSEFFKTLAKQEFRKLGSDNSLKFTLLGFFFNFDFAYDVQFFDYENLLKNSTIEKRRENFAFSSLLRYDFPFGQDNIFYLLLNHKIDFNQYFGKLYTYKTEIGWQNKDFFSFGCSYANLYNLPSFYDLFWQVDAFSMGNENLGTEKSQKFSLFSSLKFSKAEIKASYNQNKINDLIYWYPSVYGIYKPYNLWKAEIRNCEIQTKIFPLKYFTLGANLLFSSAKNKTKGDLYNKNVVYNPKYYQVLYFDFNFSQYFLHYEHIFCGSQSSTLDQLIEDIAAYNIANVQTSYQINYQNFQITPNFKINNLFDKMYEIYSQIPLPNRNWEISLKIAYKFN